ncbi:hypothetical protein HELRODRAFT_166577 [Helobdella robusta]|uniref:Protein-tyrosine-phosphatase n=1 Tax=Helobdella robusta TaxID=6412 RepID=T1EY97_HELRO|nr:hypothetical protein HELRODRAFT_166577 [Helobdella robusta]ESO11570.1 hypothetical protein HELRODRAFT_166577 [Helobdella robusta]
MNLFGALNATTRVTPYLFLGSIDSLNKDKIRQLGVSMVINCAKEIPNVNLPGVEVIKLDIDDIPSAKIEDYFDQCSDLIRSVKNRNGHVLVHCAAGVSRSASICLAYLMKHHGMSLRRAYSHLKVKRPIIRPNVGFFRQLMEYEKKLFGNSSVCLVRSRLGLVPDVYADTIPPGLHFPAQNLPASYTAPYPHVSSRFHYTSLANSIPYRFGNDLSRRWSP